MLSVMGLAEQWARVVASLPEGWERVDLVLSVEDGGARRQAAALLSPLAPGHAGRELRFSVSRQAGVGPGGARRLLAGLDRAGIAATLTLAGSAACEVVAEPRGVAALVDQWDALVASLPEDWSDLLCRLDLRSSDDLPRAALLAAPLNPSRPEKEIGFDFRVARRFGYGASPQMARRCLARLDADGIRGSLVLVRALADTQPAATQGPVWYVGGKVL